MERLDLFYIYAQLRYVEEKTKHNKTYPLTLVLWNGEHFNERVFLRFYSLRGLFIYKNDRYEYYAKPSIALFKDPNKLSYKYPLGSVTFKKNGKSIFLDEIEVLYNEVETELNKEHTDNDTRD